MKPTANLRTPRTLVVGVRQANDTLPELRRIAGCKDGGYGTYTTCTEEQDFKLSDLVDKFFEGAFEGIRKKMEANKAKQ